MKIKVQPHTIEIEKETDINAGEYNISSCEFEFSEEYEGLTKEAVFSICDSTYKVAILSGVCTIPEEVLTSQGQVLLGVYAYELTGEAGHEELVLRYSPTPKYFNVSRGSYREGNDPDLPKPSEWERVLALINEAIEETNNLNITVDKENKVTHVVLTKKDGTTEEVDIEDGKSLEFNWQGTSLGVRVEGQSEYQYVNLKGDKGDAGAIKVSIVQTLPATGQEDTIYLVPYPIIEVQELPATGLPKTIYYVIGEQKYYIYKSNEWEQTENLYQEYLWINNRWEEFGSIGIQVDLTDYVKFTDTASMNKAGVIKVGQFNTGISDENLYCQYRTYAQYQEDNNNIFISKGTLENAINGKGLVSNTNYATSSTGGVIKTETGLGTYLNANGTINASTRTYSQYNSANNELFIGKGTLENVITGKDLTTKAYVDSLVGDINSALDTINGEVI